MPPRLSRPARSAPLTALAVERAKKSTFVGGAPGLQLYVSANGARSWRLFYRLPGSGKRRAMGLGKFPSVSLAEARTRAHKCLAMVADGADPKTARKKRAVQSVFTVNLALDQYVAHCRHENSRQTAADKARAFKNHVRPHVGQRALVSVERAEWLDVTDRLSKWPAAKRNVFAYLRHFLSWAHERDMINAHPLAGVRPPKALPSRERVLSDEEIRALWRQTGETADMARIALLTGQRQGSIAAMRWEDLDLDRAIWSIPGATMKSGKRHDVPLSGLALEILSRQARLPGPYVFGVGSLGMRPYNGFHNGMRFLRRDIRGEPNRKGQRVSAADRAAARRAHEEAKKAQWRFHDLRRTAVSLAQRGGASIDAVVALTQHKLSGVIRVYAQYGFTAEKRAVVSRIEGEVVRLLQEDIGVERKTRANILADVPV